MKYILFFSLLLSVNSTSWGAFGTNTAWAIQSSATASNANGAGFDWGNANFATDLTCTAATSNSANCTSNSFAFLSRDSGAKLVIQSGTNWFNSATGNSTVSGNACWYTITSVVSGAINVDTTVGHANCTNLNAGYPFPAFQPNTTAGIASISTPINGVWSIDFSQSDSSPITGSDLASTSVTTLTASTEAPNWDWVGNGIHIISGTGYTVGWYEVLSVSGGAVTTDRTFGSTGLTGGVFNLGGAASLNSAVTGQTDQSFLGGLHMTAGNRIFITKTPTIAATITGVAGTNLVGPIIFEGFNSVRGDSPTGSSRPTLQLNGFNWATGGYNQFYHLIITGTNAAIITASGDQLFYDTKISNTSTTANRTAITLNSNAELVLGCELISYHGIALSAGTASFSAIGNYIHDSDIGILSSATSSGITIDHNIISANVSAGIKFTGINTFPQAITNNTIVGVPNQYSSGNGLQLTATGLSQLYVSNNIFYGFSNAGILNSGTNALPLFLLQNNDFYNNASDVSGIAKGLNGLSVDPRFTNFLAVTGTTATSLTNVLTDGTANFASVIDGQDFCHIVSGTGTGLATGEYLITAHTSTTLTLSSNITTSGSGSVIVYQTTTGHNFTPTATSITSSGFPAQFSNITTSYPYIGAVNGVASGTSSGGPNSYASN